jgi:hypothetical protein
VSCGALQNARRQIAVPAQPPVIEGNAQGVICTGDEDHGSSLLFHFIHV